MPKIVKTRPATILAMDPGDVHVGMAVFKDDPSAKLGWRCVRAWEETPEDAQDFVASELSSDLLDQLVVEEWRLYPQNAREKIGNDFPASQLIGSIKYLARAYGCPVQMQPAQMRLAAKAAVAKHGVPFKAKTDRTGGHSLDAELHGWTYIIRTGLVVKPSPRKKGPRK